MNPNSRMNVNLDRRRTFRKVPEKFAFIQLERDDGGAVLNVSEGGLSFNTFAPVEQTGPIHFWFSLNLSERIDAWGEVTWTDETKTFGGFGEMEDERFAPKPRRPRAPILSSGILTSSEDSVDSNASLPLAGVAPTGELVPMQRFRTAKRRQLILGLLLGICISVTVAVAAIKYSNGGHEKTSPRTVSSVSTPQKSGGEVLPPVPASPSATSGSSAAIFGSTNHKTGVSGASTSKILAAGMGGHPSPNKSESSASNLPARPPIQPNLNSKANQKKTFATPQQLWAS